MPKSSHMPKPNPTCNTVPQPKKSILSTHKCSSLTHIHIPKSLHSSQPISQPSASSASLRTCVKQLVQHLTCLNGPSPSFPNPCVPQTSTFLPGTQPAPPTHGAPEPISAESPHSTSTESLTSSNDSSDTSPHSTTLTASTCILWLRLAITYNEAALSCLHRRPQLETLDNVSIPHPLTSEEESPSDSHSDDQDVESPTATEAEANSPHGPEEVSPAGTPDDGVPSQTGGGVTSRDDQLPKTGVTSKSDVWLPTADAGVTNSRKDCPDQLPKRATNSEQRWQDDTKRLLSLKSKDIVSIPVIQYDSA